MCKENAGLHVKSQHQNIKLICFSSRAQHKEDIINKEKMAKGDYSVMATTEKIKTRGALGMIFKDRQVLAILILGLASGLPYAAVGGTLNAWMSTSNVDTKTIGLLSWTGLAYAFKFMWAAALQSRRTPFKLNIGPRRFWMFLFQALITVGLFIIAFSDPPNGIGKIALISVIIAIFSASFDIVQSAWRIESARDERHLDILSTVEQFGYRTASLLGGFVALLLADNFGWKPVFKGGAVLMAFTMIGVLLAKPTPLAVDHNSEEDVQNRLKQGRFIAPKTRHIATSLVIAGWIGGFYQISTFMYGALTDPANHSTRTFMRTQSPIVIGLTVVLLAAVAAYLVWQDTKYAGQKVPEETDALATSPLDILYVAILEPMMEILGRLKWAAVLILALVMTYRFTDAIWGSFAYPFYLNADNGALGHTLSEVGVASKLVGVIATILGIALAGISMLKFGRMPVLFVGAILAAITNLLYADIARSAIYMDQFLSFTNLDSIVPNMGNWLKGAKFFSGMFEKVVFDQRMSRLIVTITAENIAGGFASAATIAYLSSIVNKEYAAVQYALLASLTYLFGVLGRPLIGEIIADEGYAYTFVLCAWLGGFAVVLSALEWARQSRQAKAAK